MKEISIHILGPIFEQRSERDLYNMMVYQMHNILNVEISRDLWLICLDAIVQLLSELVSIPIIYAVEVMNYYFYNRETLSAWRAHCEVNPYDSSRLEPAMRNFYASFVAAEQTIEQTAVMLVIETPWL